MKLTILIADDDPNVRELVRFYLAKEGYQVLACADGNEASQLLEQESIQLAIVDVMMPGKNGWELCREIREYYDLPVIMLTAKGEVRDKEKGFLAGTDDYLTKPFEPTELLYRIKALLRRYQMVSKQIIVMNDTVIDRISHVVKVKEELIHLPLKEFELLAQLASFPDRTFTRDQLLELVWGGDSESDSRTIDVHIKRLREKFTDKTDDFVISTVRGLGYKLEVRSS
ncbi:response regulator transcription factor [Brevibacillus sp. 179-C9.3 HS]|uniref:response regulator transcription factor n=1 Tax=unclassified Brevibacillus TaxID=2684853 RepID=UPI0039A36A6F